MQALDQIVLQRQPLQLPSLLFVQCPTKSMFEKRYYRDQENVSERGRGRGRGREEIGDRREERGDGGREGGRERGGVRERSIWGLH